MYWFKNKKDYLLMEMIIMIRNEELLDE